MKLLFIIGLLFAIVSVAPSAQAMNCDSACQVKQINSYFLALDNVSRKNSSVADIDALLTLTHEDVKYVHVEYQANFTKTTWRKAFIRNLERGAYQNGAANEMRVLNTILGKNHVAVEYSHGTVQANGIWKPTEPLLAIFGFKQGKISLIKELW